MKKYVLCLTVARNYPRKSKNYYIYSNSLENLVKTANKAYNKIDRNPWLYIQLMKNNTVGVTTLLFIEPLKSII